MRKAVVQMLRPLHAISVENGMCHPGTPDINCILGWIECKATNNWPAKPDTVVRLDHEFTPQQRIFATKRRKAGGGCWLLLTVDRDWMLFHGDEAAEWIGTKTREQLIKLALRVWTQKPTGEELICSLIQTSPKGNVIGFHDDDPD
jgi:hypothetical protein